MPGSPQDAGALTRLIEECLQSAIRLEQHLTDERQALERQDDAALCAASDGKRACVARLENLERQRRALCRTRGQDAGAEHMPAVLSRCSTEPRIAADWQQFLGVIADCNRLNAANGAVIHLRQRQFQAALGILCRARTEGGSLYGPAGGPASGRSRALATV